MSLNRKDISMNPLQRLEGVIKILLIVMLVVSICLISAWLLSERKSHGDNPEPAAGTGQNSEAANTQLAGKMDLLPDKCTLNQDLSSLAFTGESGEEVALSKYKGKTVVLNFWASWCPHCNRELEQAGDIQQVLKEYPNVEFLLVNKLDNKKETKAQALDYLKKNQIPFESVFDQDLVVYNLLGLKVIPTTLVLDGSGRLKAWYAGKDMNAARFRSMLDYAVNGAATGTLSFIEKELTDQEGGVRTNYIAEKDSALKHTDVLSESQGLTMEYAVKTMNKGLFEKSYGYVIKNMKKDSLVSWLVSENGPARVNSAIDDLRIFRAVYAADGIWGGYADFLKKHEEALYRYNVKDKNLVNQYDFKYKKKSGSLKLCFADFEALEKLKAVNSRWEPVYNNSLTVVNDGFLGEGFPMYHSEYDYSRKVYKSDEINMAEGLVTLLHLSKIGQIKPQTIRWLKKAMDGDGIFARYNPDGTVAKGYGFESTAIYANVYMIANTVGDLDLANKALARMETMRIFDWDNKLNGAFGNPDGTVIYSFDQCMALLAYGTSREKILSNP